MKIALKRHYDYKESIFVLQVGRRKEKLNAEAGRGGEKNNRILGWSGARLKRTICSILTPDF
jgi:hypothetical protein